MNNERIDLTGRTFGDLTVTCLSNNRGDDGTRLWECKCVCDNVIFVHSYSLVHGHYKSCGCKHAQKRDAGAKKHIESDRVNGTRKSALKAKLHKGNKSGVKGVRYNDQRKKWTAHIGFKGKQISLGYFDKKEDAINARKSGEEKYHKPYLEDDKNDN